MATLEKEEYFHTPTSTAPIPSSFSQVHKRYNVLLDLSTPTRTVHTKLKGAWFWYSCKIKRTFPITERRTSFIWMPLNSFQLEWNFSLFFFFYYFGYLCTLILYVFLNTIIYLHKWVGDKLVSNLLSMKFEFKTSHIQKKNEITTS